MAFKELFVFVEESGPVFPAGHLGVRDIISHSFQPGNDFVNRFPGCRFANGMELSHYLVKIADRDLCSINELECAPANCRRVRINSSNSTADLKKGHGTLLKKLCMGNRIPFCFPDIHSLVRIYFLIISNIVTSGGHRKRTGGPQVPVPLLT